MSVERYRELMQLFTGGDYAYSKYYTREMLMGMTLQDLEMLLEAENELLDGEYSDCHSHDKFFQLVIGYSTGVYRDVHWPEDYPNLTLLTESNAVMDVAVYSKMVAHERYRKREWEGPVKQADMWELLKGGL